MHTLTQLDPSASKESQYQQICHELSELLGSETDLVANAANAAALLFHSLPDVNWVGFYMAQDDELVLGPFQGKPACSRIAFGKGVCGTAAAKRETIRVPDVARFPGHIACDTASRSEVVVPLLNWGHLVGVLDIDSPCVNRFDDDDQEGLEAVASIFMASLASNDLPDLSEEAASV